MNWIRAIVLLVIVSILFACASKTTPIQYYSLNLVENFSGELEDNRELNLLPRIVIEPVQLSSFLRKSGLVMQLGNHQIYTANYHRWAEPLEEAIAKLLVNQLNQKSKDYRFDRSAGQWNYMADFSLRLDFEKFHSTNSARTYVSGYYWFYSKNNKELKLNNTFEITERLEKDGYLHSVEKLQLSIDKLSDQIIESLELL